MPTIIKRKGEEMNLKEMKEIAEKAGALTDLTPTFFEFTEKGVGFVGRLKHISTVQSGLSEGVYNQYLFETDEGLIKCAFGAATDKEVAPMMKTSGVYIVEYLGKVKITGGRSVNKFKVQEIDESAVPKGKATGDIPF